jgi:F-type H+-transporting ATPase subunit epsilon
MRLVVTLPSAVVLDVRDVGHVRAEDDSGSFGIQPGHADFLTVLGPSVITWKDSSGSAKHVAVRGGVMTVRGGDRVEVATGEALAGEDLDLLERTALVRFRQARQAEDEARAGTARLCLAILHEVWRFVRPERAGPIGIRPRSSVREGKGPPP